MAKRSSQTFAKRQKEMARKEKQAAKAQKRAERNQIKALRPAGQGPEILYGPQELYLDDDLDTAGETAEETESEPSEVR
jgi:hypothetical protein